MRCDQQAPNPFIERLLSQSGSFRLGSGPAIAYRRSSQRTRCRAERQLTGTLPPNNTGPGNGSSGRRAKTPARHYSLRRGARAEFGLASVIASRLAAAQGP